MHHLDSLDRQLGGASLLCTRGILAGPFPLLRRHQSLHGSGSDHVGCVIWVGGLPNPAGAFRLSQPACVFGRGSSGFSPGRSLGAAILAPTKFTKRLVEESGSVPSNVTLR